MNITFANGIPIKVGIEALHRTCKARLNSVIYKPRKNLPTQFLLSLLLLSGNVESNPAPQCTTCLKDVRRKQKQKGVQCNCCNGWFHDRCIDMSSAEYRNIKYQSCTWACRSCNLSTPNLCFPAGGNHQKSLQFASLVYTLTRTIIDQYLSYVWSAK